MSDPGHTGRARPAGGRTTSLQRVRWASAALVVVFTAHNAEELVGLPSFLASDRAPALAGLHELYRPDRFLLAVALLTVVVIAMLAPAAVRGTPRATVVALLPAGALLANALSHVVQALVLRAYVPGLLSAVLLMLPVGVLLVRALGARAPTRAPVVLALLAAGGVLSVPTIVAALLLANVLLR